MSAGECQTKNKLDYAEEEDKPVKALDEGDIALLKTYGVGPYTNAIKAIEEDIKKHQDKVKELIGIKESDTVSLYEWQWNSIQDIICLLGTITAIAMGFGGGQADDAGRTTSAGGSMHEDHSLKHGRSEIRD